MSKEKIRKSFDRIAVLPDICDRNRFYHRYLLRLLPDDMDKALDIGCGTGTFTRAVAGKCARVTGIDLSDRMIEEACKRNPCAGTEYRVGDVERLDLGVGVYDAVVSIATFHHLDLDIVLPKIRDSLKQGGVLLVLDLYKPRTLSEHLLAALAVIPNWCLDRIVFKGREPSERKQLWIEHEELDDLPTMEDIRAKSAQYTPDARIRKHLFWRYSLRYRK